MKVGDFAIIEPTASMQRAARAEHSHKQTRLRRLAQFGCL